MTDLVRRNSSGTVSSSTAAGGGGASTADLAFDGTAPRWDDLPAHIRSATRFSGAAAAAEVDPGPPGRVRHRDGGYWQPWTAWVARRDGIALIRLRRVMTRLDGKKFKPTGELVVDGLEEYAASAPPGRRRATLSAATVGHADGGESAFSPASGSDDEGLRTLAYLPAVVQHDVLTEVSAPTFSHGCLWQMYSSANVPMRHEIALLRMTAESAIVVAAAKEVDTLPPGIDVAGAQARVAAQPWDVTRYRYQLHDKVVRGELAQA